MRKTVSCIFLWPGKTDGMWSWCKTSKVSHCCLHNNDKKNYEIKSYTYYFESVPEQKEFSYQLKNFCHSCILLKLYDRRVVRRKCLVYLSVCLFFFFSSFENKRWIMQYIIRYADFIQVLLCTIKNKQQNKTKTNKKKKKKKKKTFSLQRDFIHKWAQL